MLDNGLLLDLQKKNSKNSLQEKHWMKHVHTYSNM